MRLDGGSGGRVKRNVVLWVVVLIGIAATARPAPGEGAVPGSAGTDTALAATASQVTVAGHGDYADLRITVNQTRDLVNQAISVTWTGAIPTRPGPGRFAGHYLQLMQCWGDDDGTVAANPGPPPEQCVQGATDAVYGGRNAGIFPAGGFALERIVSRRDWPNYPENDGHLDTRTGFVWKPFRAVDGTMVDVHYDPNFNPAIVGGNYWLNRFFNSVTTNEIAAGRTGPDGTGADLFEVTTGVESSGLGCGQAVQPSVSGGHRVPRCWLVVVPRGSPATENTGTPFADTADQVGVFTSPLSKQAWANRIAIPLEFTPVDSPCELSADQRQLAGSELIMMAVSSWQPKLCAAAPDRPYVYAIVSDTSARQQLLRAAPGGPGMVVVSRPLDPTVADADNPLVYAPVAASGIVVGFTVERDPRLDAGSAAEALRGVRVAHLNLTPRLAAKLLTQSYRTQFAIKSLPPPDGYEWASENPSHLAQDPDFLQFNPEFSLLQIANGKNFGGFIAASRNSDAARQMWEWVLADGEARAWLDGAPDAWGMRVNPVYATAASANPSGIAFNDPVPDSLPKSDPYCYQAPHQGSGGSILPPLLCGTDWLPYTRSWREAARITRLADDGARTSEDPFAITADRVWRPNGPQPIGSRSILSVTDSPSAIQYGIQMARLSRAGDDGPDRTFIAPDHQGLTAGLEAMLPKDEPAVREPEPTADVAGAYPLTAISYAAIRPLSQDDQSRADYAAFIEYAAGAGQEPGRQLGQLPPGYAPLSAAMRTQALHAASAIREMQPPPADEDAAASEPTPGPPPPDGGGGATDADVQRALAPTDTASGGRSEASSDGDTAASPHLATATDVSGIDEAVARAKTAAVTVAATRYAVPLLIALALLAALGALEITKRPRRATGGDVR